VLVLLLYLKVNNILSMIYKGIYQKHPEFVEFAILLFISFIVSAVFERVIGINEELYNIWLSFLFSALIKIACFILLGAIYYKLIKKKSNTNPEESEV
jgi:hypothetical protein